VRESTLLSGESSSCGCQAAIKAGKRLRTHGLSKHPLYNTWKKMLYRCNKESAKDYKHYGGRGIAVCSRWSLNGIEGFKNFLEDMEESFEYGLELDRIDVNGNYEKDNCKWSSRREQVINRRLIGSYFDTHYLEYDGKKLCMSQWADITRINKQIISDRISKLKWSVQDALTKPIKPRETVVIIDEIEYKLNEVFKNPTNLYTKIGKRFTLYQYLSNMMSGFATIKVYLNKTWHAIDPSEDNSDELWRHLYTDRFKSILEQLQ